MSATALARLTRHRLFWPVAVLAPAAGRNAVFTPGFFAVEVRDGHLTAA